MKISELKQAGKDRLQGEWWADFGDVYCPVRSDNVWVCDCSCDDVNSTAIRNATFITTAANNWDKMIAVIEAAKGLLKDGPLLSAVINLKEEIEELEK